jgi:hypothetical protein
MAGLDRNAVSLHVPATQLYPFFLPVRRKRKMSLAAPTDVFPLYLKQKTMAQNYVNGQFISFIKRGCVGGPCVCLL